MTQTNQMASRVAARYKNKKNIESPDGKKRTVYEYSERQVQIRNKDKARKVQKLEENISGLRKKVKTDLASKDNPTFYTALAVALIDATYERVGNPQSASDGHFGVTGWKVEHISFKGSTATVKYVGKSGVAHTRTIDGPKMVTYLKRATESKKPGDDLFGFDGKSVGSSDVNGYLKPHGVTAKDLRGFHANREMRERLKKYRSDGSALPSEKGKRKKVLMDEWKKALKETADIVGHTESILQSSYLVPGLKDQYLRSGTLPTKHANTNRLERSLAMPAGVVKPGEKKYWNQAKKIVEEQYGTVEGHYGVVMEIFKNKVKKHKGREVGGSVRQIARRVAASALNAAKKLAPQQTKDLISWLQSEGYGSGTATLEVENYQKYGLKELDPSIQKDFRKGLKFVRAGGSITLVASQTRTAKVNPRSPKGTRVVMNANPASRMLYGDYAPVDGMAGTVAPVLFPGGKRRTYIPGPGGGMIYVLWDDGTSCGVAPRDLDKE